LEGILKRSPHAPIWDSEFGQIFVARLVFGFVTRRIWFTRAEVKPFLLQTPWHRPTERRALRWALDGTPQRPMRPRGASGARSQARTSAPTSLPRDLWLCCPIMKSTRPTRSWRDAGVTQSLRTSILCSARPRCVHARQRESTRWQREYLILRTLRVFSDHSERQILPQRV
jgi:hypothetical protein